MSFGDKLKKLRKEKGWTQDKLAKIVNMHSKHISKYEQGLVNPTSDAIIKIAKAFDVSTDYLLFDEDKNKEILKSIEDNRILKLLKELDNMDKKDKETILSIIDAYSAKKKMKNIIDKK